MFSIIDTCGWNDSMSSSWKLLTSSTAIDEAPISETTDENAVPIFPATAYDTCASFKSLPMSVVVVVFPFVPVTAMIGALQNQLATSISLTILSPLLLASRTTGAFDGTPGL